MASAEQVANGGAALPNAAAAAAAARLGSRTNTLFSIPMLFFMGASSHLIMPVTPDSKMGLFWGIFAVIWAALEINALKGKEGPMQTLKGVIACGFVLALLVYGVLEVCLSM